jgi:sulfur-carrier protein
MATITIPTPFRPYTGGASSLEIQASDVGGAIEELVAQYPPLAQHLFKEEGDIRPFVNLFLNGDDIRFLNGKDTKLAKEDKLRLIPSIAGGNSIAQVDQSALKTNQGTIVLLSVLAFLLNNTSIVAVVAIIMLIGTLVGKPGFSFLYKYGLRPLKILKPAITPDDPAAHRFAQGVGVAVLGFALISFASNYATLGWVFTWVVILLALINLVSGFCLGCTLYYFGKKRKNNKLASAKGTH